MSISMTGWALIPDAIEVDEFKTGQRREGLHVGVILFCRKFSVALALWFVGIALSWIGYVPGEIQTTTSGPQARHSIESKGEGLGCKIY